MSFESLIGDLQALSDAREQQVLAKSLAAADAADDDKVTAAAAEAGATLPEDGEAADDETDADAAGGEGGEGDEGDDEGEPFGKSFFDQDGNPVEVVDATEMLKSLGARLEQTELGAGQAIGLAVDLIKSQGATIQSQGELLKSLATKVESLASRGRGRVATLSVADKPSVGEPLAKSEPAGVAPQEFMAKALEAQRFGRLTGRDVSIAEGYLQKGLAVPADIVNRVFAS